MDIDIIEETIPPPPPPDFTEQTTITIDLDPTKLAEQLEVETGDAWTPEIAAAALAAIGTDMGGFVSWLREKILEQLASEHFSNYLHQRGKPAIS